MAFDSFLKLDGIPGESADAKHPGEIAVESFAWGETQTVAHPGTGGGASAGRVSMQDLHFTARVSKASPLLLLACAAGRHVATAVLSVRRTSQEGDFLTFALSDVLVTGYQVGGSEAGGPVDSVALNFGRIVMEYREHKPDGTLGPKTKAGWDLHTNTQV